jgi:hypothetical protein
MMNNQQPIGIRVERWHCSGLPAEGLSQTERKEVMDDMQGSFLAEHAAMSERELMSLDDKALVEAHYWAMVEATR